MFMRPYIVNRVLDAAEYVMTGKTIRSTAKWLGTSKSTVHADLARRLKELDPSLYDKVKAVLDYNLSVRHVRGGQATKLLLSKKK